MSDEPSDRQENRKAKLELIEAYFRDLDRRSEFLVELSRNDHMTEALLLCCCYIEAMGGNLYWPDRWSSWNFVRVLKEYGGEEVLRHIHPKQLRIGLGGARSNGVQKIGRKLGSVLAGAEGRLYTEEQILTLVKRSLTADEVETLKRNLWRGTLAALAYDRLRSSLVHELSTGDGVSFDRTTFKGGPVPDLDFRFLHPVLGRIIRAMKKLSLASGKWYGHDFKGPAGAKKERGT